MNVVATYLLWFCLVSLQGGDAASCTNGFPTRLVDGTTTPIASASSGPSTILIPEMNFTCNASIVGFTVAGRDLNTSPHSQIQIWRKNSSQNSDIYYQTGNSILVHIPYSQRSGGVCMAAQRIARDTFWCILNDDNMQVSVQPGDIFGLATVRSTTDEILFTDGGPVNHVFENPDQLGSYVNLSVPYHINRNDSITQQLPQIAFNLTSDYCTREFPAMVTSVERTIGHNRKVSTILFPDLKFGCFGTIVGVTAAVVGNGGTQKDDPKIQIWRENKTRPGVYHKIGSDLPLNRSDPGPPCYQHTYDHHILQCILSEGHRISVQPGDFLGLEIPPTNNDDLDISFKSGGPINLVFRRQLGSIANRFTETHCVAKNEPQINFLVVLDDHNNMENKDSYPDNIPTITPLPTATTVHVDIVQTSTIAVTTADIDTIKSETSGLSSAIPSTGCTATAGVTGATIAILLLVVIILLVAVLIQRRHRKQYSIASNGHANPIANPNYDGTSYNRILLTQECQTRYKDDDTPANYDHIKFNVKKEAVSLHADDQTFNATYEMLETQHYEMTGPTLATHEEPYIYWEPAKTVNDLHKQMSSNKYRELLRQQVKITKTLGSGQFGVVSMGVWQSPTGTMEVAVKQLQPGATETEKIKFLQEAAINGQFRHPNVVQLMGVVTTGKPAMIVLELLSNGDLRNFLIKHQTPPKLESGGVDKHLLLQFCQHIASGMSYLASKAFVHRDLAARNILVSKDKICKISDFGMSRDLLDEDYYVSHGGMIPVKWTAPEAIHYKKYSTASDVWSFGCVMYEIWSLGHKPFESYNNPEVIKMIDKGYRLPPPPGLSKELYKIMIQCWQLERSCRPTFPQLVELLSRADFELFLWEEEDLRNSDPRVKEIGAPLEIATGLYPELQKIYLGKQ